MKRKIILSFLAVLSIISVLSLGLNLKAATGSTRFNLKQNTNLITLKQGDIVTLEVGYSNNSQSLYEIELNLLYEASKFNIIEVNKEIGSLFSLNRTEEVLVVDDNCYVQFRGYSTTPITGNSGSLFSIKLESTAAASNTSIVLQIVQSVVHDEAAHSAVQGTNVLGSSTVSFSDTLIPWWIWLVLGAVIVVALVGGYIFHLFAPKFLGAAANKTKDFGQKVGKKTKELSLQVAAKTKQLTNQLFNRKPVAPKMKPSSPQSSTGAKPQVKPVTSTARVIKPVSTASKPDSEEKK
jgi:hypothetical protein